MSGFCESEHQNWAKGLPCLRLLLFFYSPYRHKCQKVADRRSTSSESLRGLWTNPEDAARYPVFRKNLRYEFFLRTPQSRPKNAWARRMSSVPPLRIPSIEIEQCHIHVVWLQKFYGWTPWDLSRRASRISRSPKLGWGLTMSVLPFFRLKHATVTVMKVGNIIRMFVIQT